MASGSPTCQYHNPELPESPRLLAHGSHGPAPANQFNIKGQHFGIKVQIFFKIFVNYYDLKVVLAKIISGNTPSYTLVLKSNALVHEKKTQPALL